MKLYHGDCLEVMAQLPDASVDMILCDLPYGTTACKWDTVIPFEPLWAQYRRVAKRNAAIVLTASQPFTSALVMSNPKWFRYDWVWQKSRNSNPMLAKIQPLRHHESVLVFSGSPPAYFPQMEQSGGHPVNNGAGRIARDAAGASWDGITRISSARYPRTVIPVANPSRGNGNFHPTQKPVALMEYLIRTYTQEGETVLDNCMGSGTTGVACANTGRRFVGIERDDKYFAIASERIAAAVTERLDVLTTADITEQAA